MIFYPSIDLSLLLFFFCPFVFILLFKLFFLFFFLFLLCYDFMGTSNVKNHDWLHPILQQDLCLRCLLQDISWVTQVMQVCLRPNKTSYETTIQ